MVKKLANLGSTIPTPAFIECIQAYLSVYLGNYYGVSTEAASIAYRQLANISEEKWLYYFEKVIQNDEIVLNKMNEKQVDRFRTFLLENNLSNFGGLPKKNQILYDSLLAYNWRKAKQVANDMSEAIKK